MKYRSRTEICSNILEAANGGTTKTKIMYKAFLSFAQLKDYLALLIENELLSINADGIYRTTEKGFRYLQTIEQLGGMLEMPHAQSQALQ
jgi:predicted transcriptional regulator